MNDDDFTQRSERLALLTQRGAVLDVALQLAFDLSPEEAAHFARQGIAHGLPLGDLQKVAHFSVLVSHAVPLDTAMRTAYGISQETAFTAALVMMSHAAALVRLYLETKKEKSAE